MNLEISFAEYKYLIYSDLYRVTGNFNIISLLKHILKGSSLSYNFWLRTCHYAKNSLILKCSIYPFAKIIHHRLTYKLGISISPNTKVGSGLYIGHFGGIIVNENSVIGKNCNISQGVTLGKANRGRNKGYPVLGNNVYIGPGAKIVGAVKIGNNVAIGANCVVTRNIADHSVVVGIPGKVISKQGSEGYINRTDYDKL
jgi:serine O-acetyltransferase